MPMTVLEPTEVDADATDARLEHGHRPSTPSSDAPEPIPPIPHYADSPDPETCTTAISEVT